MSWQDEEDCIELCGTFKRQTEKAYLIEINGDDIWFPRSQILGGNFEPEKLIPGIEIEFSISAWLADQKELR